MARTPQQEAARFYETVIRPPIIYIPSKDNDPWKAYALPEPHRCGGTRGVVRMDFTRACRKCGRSLT